MSGISSKALNFGSPQNRFKFNGGNELQSNEFTDGSGLEMFDAINRMYDPQIGRFWQVDELAEANWEESPYSFAHNDPILFNDPLGLEPDPAENGGKAKVLQEVRVYSIPKSYWAKMNLYYLIQAQLNKQGASYTQLVQPGLWNMMDEMDQASRIRTRVAEMTRESDKVALEAGSWLIPTSWLLKAKYLRYAAKVFKLKRGKAAVKVTEEVVEHIDDVAKNGETAATKLGKAMHKAYKAEEVVPGVKMKEFVLPSGNRIDFIDLAEKIIYELKPNNAKAIREGTKQLAKYLKEVESIYGEGFKTVLDKY